MLLLKGAVLRDGTFFVYPPIKFTYFDLYLQHVNDVYLYLFYKT